MLKILGSNYQTTDKGQHIAPKVDAKIKRLVLQKSFQKKLFLPVEVLSFENLPKLILPHEEHLFLVSFLFPESAETIESLAMSF